MRTALILVLAIATLSLAACEVNDDSGTCFWQYNAGDVWGFGCHKSIGSEDECQNLAAESYGLDSVVQFEWSQECQPTGCSDECHPDWWSLY